MKTPTMLTQAVRLPRPLVRRVDAYRAGLGLSRVDVLRLALSNYLTRAEMAVRPKNGARRQNGGRP